MSDANELQDKIFHLSDSSMRLWAEPSLLARIRLDDVTIERIEKESGMSIEPMVDFYRDTEVGHRLQSIGREEGREEGREAVLLALLQSRFGGCSQARDVARRLADWDDQATAVAAIMGSSDLPSLVSAEAASVP